MTLKHLEEIVDIVDIIDLVTAHGCRVFTDQRVIVNTVGQVPILGAERRQ